MNEWPVYIWIFRVAKQVPDSVYFLCICRCGGHKVYAKLKTNVDECVGPT